MKQTQIMKWSFTQKWLTSFPSTQILGCASTTDRGGVQDSHAPTDTLSPWLWSHNTSNILQPAKGVKAVRFSLITCATIFTQVLASSCRDLQKTRTKGVNRHEKNPKITQLRFVPKKIYPKKCVNCNKSEFSTKQCKRPKVPKSAIKCHKSAKKYHKVP